MVKEPSTMALVRSILLPARRRNNNFENWSKLYHGIPPAWNYQLRCIRHLRYQRVRIPRFIPRHHASPRHTGSELFSFGTCESAFSHGPWFGKRVQGVNKKSSAGNCGSSDGDCYWRSKRGWAGEPGKRGTTPEKSVRKIRMCVYGCLDHCWWLPNFE